MATWGVGAFENDDARQFLAEVQEDGLFALEEAFDVVLDSEGELEAPEGARAVAAAALLAAILTGEAGGVPQEARGWVVQQRPEGVESWRAPALSALDLVQSDASDLPAVWLERGQYDAWQTQLLALRERLVLP